MLLATSIHSVETHIAPLRKRLVAHPLYRRMSTLADIRAFIELHVFAVWDFMSLLTALKRELTGSSVPWLPTPWPESRRFINEIVLGEESDTYEGRALSHFELYLEAMEECGADTACIRSLLSKLSQNPRTPLIEHLDAARVPAAAQSFVKTTFEIIQSGNIHAIAAAFTFGREDLIPDMFRQLVRDLNEEGTTNLSKFIWYLERHIEVDGEEHGPLSLRMVEDLCANDERRWEQAAKAAEKAITARLALWDAVLNNLRN